MMIRDEGMDERTDGRTDGRLLMMIRDEIGMVCRANEGMDERTDGQTDGRLEGRTNEERIAPLRLLPLTFRRWCSKISSC